MHGLGGEDNVLLLQRFLDSGSRGQPQARNDGAGLSLFAGRGTDGGLRSDDILYSPGTTRIKGFAEN